MHSAQHWAASSGVKSCQRFFSALPEQGTIRKRRPPVRSLRKISSFVVAAKMHWRGYSSVRRPYGARNLSVCLEMKALSSSFSARVAACISPSSMMSEPMSCSSGSLPLMETMESLNHLPPIRARIVLLPMPCGPVSTRQQSNFVPGRMTRATPALKNVSVTSRVYALSSAPR